jgi:YYY domain-containing protein
VLSAYFVGIAGNLAGFFHIIYNILNSIPFDYTFYWASSRVIPETINEFPFFSFLHGDLHAHVIAIPLKLFFLLVLVSLWKHGRTVVHYTLLSFLMAVFIMTNTWDFVGMGLTLLTFLLFFEPWKRAMVSGGLITIASLGLALPFLISFEGGSDFGFVTKASPVLPFLAIYLPFFVPAFLYSRKSVKKTALLVSLLAGSVLFIMGYQIFIVALPLLILMFPKKTDSEPDKFARTLFFSGLILLLGVEVIYLDSRLNSVFKLYLQIWVLFALSVPYMLHKILSEIRKSEMKLVYWITIALIAMTAFYPPVATYTKALSYPMYTLNGAEFIKNSYPEDYLAIQWLENYAYGTILEYASPSYEYGGRISSFTGLPTVIAWYNHEVFWRKNSEEIIERIDDVKTIYSSDNATLVRELARKYNISYLYVGNLEFENYSVNFSTLSSAGFELIKTFGNSSIYKFSPG